MYAKNTNKAELFIALHEINKIYKDNIVFKRKPEMRGNRLLFTLTVNDSHGKGGRLSPTGRHIAAACWHVHGHFFDALFEINEDAEITAMGDKITVEYGNWQDKQIGSMFEPIMYSLACKCGVVSLSIASNKLDLFP